MANQDVARRREIQQDVDAVQRVVARQNTKSAASTCQVRLIRTGKLDNM